MAPLINAIFISYRRADLSQDQVNVIHEGLEKEFGDDSVFLDTSDIHSGAKWKEVLNAAGTGAKICLVLIGKNWLEPDQDGKPRILAEGDWVRKEIEYALAKNLTIIPTLVNGGQLPSKKDIPDSIHAIYDSQAMKLDMDQWSVYRERFYKDIRKILGLEKTIEIRKPIRLDAPRIALFILIPILCLIAYFFLKKNKTDPSTPPLSGITTVAQPESLPCLPFKELQKLNALIFPIESERVDNLEKDIDDEFTANCEKYGLPNENKIASCYKGKEVSSTDLPLIARQMNADLYFSGILTSLDAQHRFKARFGLSNDSLKVLQASPKDFSLALTNVSLQDLTGGQAMDTLYHHVIQYILGLVAYQKKDFQTTLNIFKDLQAHNIQSDTMQKVIYSIIVDACDQIGNRDSAILYQQKLNTEFPTDQNAMLKVGLLAEKYDRPEVAIISYSKLLDHSSYDKNILREKRADQYSEIKEYSKAQSDYREVKTKDSIQSRRVQSKVNEVDIKILNNKSAIKKVNQLEATDVQKIEVADQLLQIGQTQKAQEILNTISTSSPVFKQAEPLKQEIQLKTNPAANIPITESAAKANPRLQTEAMKRNRVLIKQN